MSLSTTINYTNPTNFTFNGALVSFPGSDAELKLVTPTGATFYNGFHTGANGEYGQGVLTGTPTGSVTFGTYYADFSVGTRQSISYAALANASFQQVGTVRFQVIPLYSGSPSQNQFFFSIGAAANSDHNLIEFVHTTGGVLDFLICNSSGATIATSNTVAWNPTAGTTYEFEIDIDITAGATRVFLQGIQQGATLLGTGVRSSAITTLMLGNYVTSPIASVSNFKLTNFIVFNSVQHTANFPGEIPRAPETQYSVTNPTVTVNSGVSMSNLLTFTETISTPANTGVQYILLVNGSPKYWNGSAWVLSNGTYAQSNTGTVINTHAPDLDLGFGATIQVMTFLSSTLGSATPSISSIVEEYEFFVPAPTLPPQCAVYTFLTDIIGQLNVDSATLYAELPKGTAINGYVIGPYKASTTFDARGYAELDLVSTNGTGLKYNFSISYNDTITTRVVNFAAAEVPSGISAALTSITSVIND